MRGRERALARTQLDKRLNSLRETEFARPPRGWVKAIREALGMTAEQLAIRIGVTRPRVHEIEKNEVSGSITLDSLARAANALDCQLVYALIPRKPLEAMSYERAVVCARAQLKSAAHSMALEDQAVDEKDQKSQLESLAKALQGSSKIWQQVK